MNRLCSISPRRLALSRPSSKAWTKKPYLKDYKTQSAVLYQMVVIGEAVKRLSHEFREHHQEIPWALIAGMRDHLIHGYDVVDWDEFGKPRQAMCLTCWLRWNHCFREKVQNRNERDCLTSVCSRPCSVRTIQRRLTSECSRCKGATCRTRTAAKPHAASLPYMCGHQE
jgi:hypothetical protein